MKKVALLLLAGMLFISASAQETQVIQYGPDIVRVLKGKSHKSYSVVMKPQKSDNPSFSWKVDGKGNVTFFDKSGKVLLKETEHTITPITSGVDAGHSKVSQSWILDKDEAIFGLGQRQDVDMNQRGKNVRIWSGNTNITIPYFTSDKGYGLYWDNAGMSQFSDTPQATNFTSEVADGVDYYFMYKDGSQDGVMAAIRDLSGQATMFPLWTMGYWQCRERYKSSDELCDVVDTYRRLGIPLDGIVQDWQYWGCDSNWNAMKFVNPRYINKLGDPQYMRYLPDDEQRNWQRLAQNTPRIKTPEDMVKYVHDQHAHIMISIWASFGPWTDQYKELKKINALLPFDTWPRNKGVLPYDPFNPKAREIYWKYLAHLYKMGFDAWWSDSTEPDHFEKPGDMDYLTYDGSWRSVKNAFPLITNIGIYEHQRKMKDGDQKRAFQMTRCGAFGLQRSAAFNWSGDITASWSVFKNQIPSGLNYTLCGIPYWNTDLGGFFYWDFEQNPKNPALAELQTRWMQWGTFLPLMRNHCSSPMISEIYLYGEEGDWAYDAQKKAVELRYRILPYTYSQCGAVVQKSETMMRPFIFDFPTDKEAINRADSYMFGHSILVRPVTDPLYTYKDEQKKGHTIYPDVAKAAAPVSTYLPKGAKWYDFYTNQVFEGGKTVMRPCPIDEMPLYVRAGSIIPLGPQVQYTSEKPWDNLEIRIYPGADADFTLYEDEGDNYNYEKGQFTQIRFHWDDASRQLTISDREGKFNGMLQNRSFNLVLVGPQTPSAELPATGKTVAYSGKSIALSL